MRPPAATTERDPALLLGIAGGLVTSLVGVVGYFLRPLATVQYVDGLSVTFAVLGYFASRSPSYHAGVLVLAPFVTTAAAILVARRRGLDGAESDLRILGGVVTGPVVTTVAAAFVAVFAVGITALPLVAYAVGFGALITTLIAAVVATAEAAGALGGYVLARGVESLVRGVGGRSPH